MPKDAEHSCSERNRVHPYRPNPNHGKIRDEGKKMEWEDATCPICMDFPHNAVLLLCSSHDRGCRPYICNTGRRHSNCLRQYQKAHLELKKVPSQNEGPNPNVIGSPPGEVNLTVEALSVTFVTVSAETGLAVSSRRFTSFDESGITITSRSVNSSDLPEIPSRIMGSVDDVMSFRNTEDDAMPNRSTDGAVSNRDNDETMSARDREDSILNANIGESLPNSTDEAMETENDQHVMYIRHSDEILTNRNTEDVMLNRHPGEELADRNAEDVGLATNSEEEIAGRNFEDVILNQNNVETGNDEVFPSRDNDALTLTGNSEVQYGISEGALTGDNEHTMTITFDEATPNRDNDEATPNMDNDEATPNRNNDEATPNRNNDEATPIRNNDEATSIRNDDEMTLNRSNDEPPHYSTFERTLTGNLVERATEAEVDSGNGTNTIGISQRNLLDGSDQSITDNNGDQERCPVDEDEEMEEPGAVDQNSEDVLDLKCPLCRGTVCGWKVVDGAREHLNQKHRNCSEESCPFVGSYAELRAHAKSEHPLGRPSEVDPARMRDWRRMEHQRNVGDVLSSIRATMPGATVIGDHVLETGSENEAEESNLLSVPALLFLHWFGSPSSGGGRIILPTAWSLRGHRRGSLRGYRRRGGAGSTENNDSNHSSANGDSEQETPGSNDHQEGSEV